MEIDTDRACHTRAHEDVVVVQPTEEIDTTKLKTMFSLPLFFKSAAERHANNNVTVSRHKTKSFLSLPISPSPALTSCASHKTNTKKRYLSSTRSRSCFLLKVTGATCLTTKSGKGRAIIINFVDHEPGSGAICKNAQKRISLIYLERKNETNALQRVHSHVLRATKCTNREYLWHDKKLTTPSSRGSVTQYPVRQSATETDRFPYSHTQGFHTVIHKSWCSSFEVST